MKLSAFGITLATLLAGVATQAQTPSWITPADSARCPSNGAPKTNAAPATT